MLGLELARSDSGATDEAVRARRCVPPTGMWRRALVRALRKTSSADAESPGTSPHPTSLVTLARWASVGPSARSFSAENGESRTRRPNLVGRVPAEPPSAKAHCDDDDRR